MKHREIIGRLVANAKNDPNFIGLLVFGSVANGTHRGDSDLDVFTVLETSEPTSGIDNTWIDGIKVGNVFFTLDVFAHGVTTVPYLLHPLAGAKMFYDREGVLQPLFTELREFFADHPEIVEEWSEYYERFREEKAQFGYEKTTIVDVWNELEKRHSRGAIKRRFLRSFSRPS